MKKIVSLILSLVFLMTASLSLGISASAETYSGDCGTNGSDLRWQLDTASGTLTITGSGEMRDYSYTDTPWYSYRAELKNVIWSADMTTVGSYAFCGCSALKEIVIPSNVTKIGNSAFSFCDGLKRVSLPEKLTSIGSDTFYDCTSLEEITIPAAVTYIGSNAFSGCDGLTKATFGNTEGWTVQEGYGYGEVQEISKEDLTDTANAAFYLRDSYCGYVWSIPSEDGELHGFPIWGFFLPLLLLIFFSLLPFVAMIAIIVFAVRSGSKSKESKKREALEAERKKKIMIAGGAGLAALAVGLVALLRKKK